MVWAVQPLTTVDGRAEPGRGPTRPGRRVLPGGRRLVWTAVAAAGTVGLFLGYLRMSRTTPVNSDGASNARQAWEMLHGNLLLRGWTVTDVSFYTTELVQYMLVELVHGYRPDVIHVAAAMTYTLLVVLAAALAKGRATGGEAVARGAVAVALMLLPAPGDGYLTLLGSPAHFGSGVPLLVTWLVLDRATDRRPERARTGWRLPVLIAVLLTWGQIGDPLVMYVGAVPLVVVSALRLWRAGGGWRARLGRLDARLAAAAVASVLLAHGFLLAVRLAGGFVAHAPPVRLSPLSQLGDHLVLAGKGLALLFGAYLPDLDGPVALSTGVVKIVGLLLVAAALGETVGRVVRGLVRRRRAASPAGGPAGGDRVTELVAASILVNLGAFVVSTLPVDLLSARQIAVVLPMGAALAGRVFGARLAAWRVMPVMPVMAVVLVFFAGVFAVRATDRPVPATDKDIGDWLVGKGLDRGLGGYWNASTITVATGGRVQVAPVTGTDRIMGYRWESRAEWYDPARADARFLVLDLTDPVYGTVATATAQFGPPVQRRDFGHVAVLVYDHNLLVGLPAYCLPEVKPGMAEC
jgi:hypothetical protein